MKRRHIAAIRTDVEVALREASAADWPSVGRAVLAEEDRLERLLSDLLTLAAGDESPPLDPGPVDLGAVASAEAGRSRRVPVEVTVSSPGRVAVAGSPDALRRAVTHLVDNAARHAARPCGWRSGAPAGSWSTTTARASRRPTASGSSTASPASTMPGPGTRAVPAWGSRWCARSSPATAAASGPSPPRSAAPASSSSCRRPG